jgi:diguanylate cyclase (GGDEF)-like protein/PAS domain S-box-containing protein
MPEGTAQEDSARLADAAQASAALRLANRRRATWEALGVAAYALALVAAGIAGLWVTSTAAIRDNYHSYLIGLAQTAATLVDPQLHEAIRRPEQRNDPDYLRAVQPLRRMRGSVPDVHYIYTVVRDGAVVRFVLDAAEPHVAQSSGLDEQAGVWEPYTEEDDAMQSALGSAQRPGVAGATRKISTDKWGSFMTGWAPLYDAAGHQIGAVGVDVDAHVYAARMAAAPKWAIFGLVPASALIALLGGVYYLIRLRGLNNALAARESTAVLEQERHWLAQSETKFRSLFELSPVGIALNDSATGQFLQVNEALVAPTGYSIEQMLALRLIDLAPACYPANGVEPFQSVDGSGRFGPYETEYTRLDGSTYPVLLSGIRLRDASGREVIWSIAQDISHRKAMESELADAARRDKLTGLANRALFMECLQRAVTRVRAGEQALYAVLFLDFDRFKLINDTLGHEAGDEMLRQIAARLRGTLRAADVNGADATSNLVCRFGGDEFLILINDLKAPQDASLVAERLLNALTPVYRIFGSELQSSASIGIVTSEQPQLSAEEVVRNADVAMYEAKRSGRACCVVFNESMHQRLTRHMAIESSLRKSLGSDQLCVVYQPIVELSSGRMVSAEALLRWNHPELGAISPSEFIPIAEESGLIIAVGEWVLKQACMALLAWRAQDPERAPATVSVNVSRAELALGNRLLEQVRSTLMQVGLPPQCLQLEVTEREVMRNPEASLALMQALRQLGVRLAMDDFGTGTSSLGFLRDYPFDVIKIDRSFVNELAINRDALTMNHATINLIENLGMASLAEGIEEPAQVAVLQSLGCRYGQGFLFSRPVPAGELLQSLATRAAELAAGAAYRDSEVDELMLAQVSQ